MITSYAKTEYDGNIEEYIPKAIREYERYKNWDKGSFSSKG